MAKPRCYCLDNFSFTSLPLPFSIAVLFAYLDMAVKPFDAEQLAGSIECFL